LCDVGLEESSAPTSRRKSAYIEELQKLATAERLADPEHPGDPEFSGEPSEGRQVPPPAPLKRSGFGAKK